MIRFVVIATLSLATVAIVSLVWPKFTNKPRPTGLQQVHDAVIKTQLGQETSNVMGVGTSTEGGITPVSLNSMVASVGSTIVNGVEQKVGDAVAGQAATILLNQIKGLPTPVQEEIKQVICKP